MNKSSAPARPRVSKILLFVLSALAAQLCMAAPEFARQRHLSPDGIRVVSANIRFPVREVPGEEWEKRKELARDVLLAQDADLICFQEFRSEHLAFLKTYFPDHEASGYVDGPDNRKSNTIFFSKKRFQKIEEGGFWLSDKPDSYRSKFPESGSVRHVATLTLKDTRTGKKLLVWNTHLDHAHQPGRDRQAAVLASFIKKIPDAPPLILTGDFNCGVGTEAIRHIKESGMTDSYESVHGPKEPGYTYHGFLGEKYGKQRAKIDFVFCNKLLKPAAAAVIRDSRDGHYPSDHYFVSAELSYSE
ncbi:MAG: endonuclease/exonuclease/phosphatase family protein [Opitutaceae bacterium]|jgi:endonuclease/exonuclease/phosphatase family metal-dependent hydrolase|nr:endonuclease/exonuclease/phosphatase family protein [Opitutaceae bacterium]